jgi:predicted ATP-binding protein involved in virulence
MSESSPKSKKKSSIRHIERRARQGDIRAMLQISEYLKDGKGIQEDLDAAEAYIREAVSQLRNRRFVLDSLELVDFRPFSELKLRVCKDDKDDSNFTVIIGENGAGKSAILEAIAKSFSWISKRIVSDAGKGDYIVEGDIRVGSKNDYATVVTNFSLEGDLKFQLELSRSKEGSNVTKKNHVQDIEYLAKLYRELNSRHVACSLPLLAFYSVKRAVEVDPKDISDWDDLGSESGYRKVDGYKNALNGSADFRLFLHWFKWVDDILNSDVDFQKNKLKIESIEKELEGPLIEDLKALDDQSGRAREILEAYIKSKKEELKLLKSKTWSRDSKEFQLMKDTIEDVLQTFLPTMRNLRVQRRPKLDLLVDKGNYSLSVLQLSQGEKSLLALVSDIARRLVILNPGLDNPLSGNGVVLIDEVDLHLHPRWQQTVLSKLAKTFPNLQFIITTHSPIVITSVESQGIRILEEGELLLAPHGVKGAEESRVLERVFGVKSRPPENEVVKKLEEYLSLVYSDCWDSERARELRFILDSNFRGEEPELTRADLYIENRLWEIDIEKNK